MDETARKYPPHFPPVERHNTPIIIFVTVCTRDRKLILANAGVHRILQIAWQTKPAWLVGRYVVMPDHVHLFCAPAEFSAKPLLTWIKFWKSISAQNWPGSGQSQVWQRHFWDTQLRRSDSYDAKWEYVRQNPVRAGLVTRSEDWLYQGELNVLRW